MGTRCMRPGCDRPAAARLTYDPVACELWLDELRSSRAAVQELCEFHVGRLTVPRGWRVTDRRAGGADAAGSTPVPGPEPVRRPEPVIEPEPDAVVEPEPEPVAEPAATAEPSAIDPAPADPVAAPESSPLLGRAFAWTGPQHSVLTTPPAESEEPAPQE